MVTYIGRPAATFSSGWSSKARGRVVDRLARDFKEAFPDMRGFSSRNLKYMTSLCSPARL
ncbi:hypothetical protein AB3X96_35185 [Paraburkholderia sp. BR13439]|uniref:hypothetical protein n=1 Tax=Paraburkholderia TaxID=1822464 RepID=UPI0034CE7E88